MKHSISVALFLLFALPGMPQSRQPSLSVLPTEIRQPSLSALPTEARQPSLSVLPTEVLRLRNTAAPLIPCSFSHFVIIDRRQDTGRLGIHNENVTFGKPENVQMVLNKGVGVSADLAAWLNEHFARPGVPYTAFIVLRALWLSDANYLRNERINDPGILYDRTHIQLKAEIYAVRDEGTYIPILRFDSIHTYKRHNPYKSLTSYYTRWENDLSDMLVNMIDSASELTAAKSEKGPRLHLEDILRFNRSRFDAPVTDSAPLNPGVYANFEEFRKNAPSIRTSDVRMEQKVRVLYIKDATGSFQYSHDAWGYCDGRNIYIMRDGILLPVWKEENAFYFTNFTTSASAFLQRRIYTIDMDSGRIY